MPINHTTQAGSLIPPNLIGATEWDDNHAITGRVDFPNVPSPTTPPADNVGVIGRKIAGRMLPAFIGPSGLDSALQPLLARNKVAWANPTGNGTTISVIGMTVTATGTATAASVATTNIHQVIRRLEYAVTTASTTAVAGWRSGQGAQYHIGSPSSIYGGFFFVCRFGRSRGVAANATLRGFTGFSSLTTAPTDVNPSTTETNAIGVGADSTDTNYQIIYRNGTAAATKVDTGIAKAVADNTEMYELAMFTSPTSTDIYVQFTRLSDNTVFNHTISTNKPADTTLLAPRGWYSVGGTSSVIGYALASVYIETDY